MFSKVTEKTKVVSDKAGVCVHCGDPCGKGAVSVGDKNFCCPGCKTVYALLHDHELEDYYQIENRPGLKPDLEKPTDRFAYLDDSRTQGKLIDFTDGRRTRVTLSIPQIHCSSCIWLLENLYVLNRAITVSRVDFPTRKLTVTFQNDRFSLRKLVELLAGLGYEPSINLSDLQAKPRDKSTRKLYAKLAIAGFAFGNVMLLSFPEYLGLDEILKPGFTVWFGYLKILLSLPVFFFSSADFFRSAVTGLRQRFINMDVPISLGILILFTRSLYDILWLGQAGYMDSLCGLVFFLLIGRLYQQKTYASLSFERDYRSYLPIAVRSRQGGREVSVPVTSLKPGDRILIRNRELIPADSVLIDGKANIDYSFVTGESDPVLAESGQQLYAGGRQMGPTLELEIVKIPSQSYLMQLWTQSSPKDLEDPSLSTLANRASRLFTPSILAVAVLTTIYWYLAEPAKALNAATAVLIVACPCALALSSPFTLGTVQRLFGRQRFFIKDPGVVERLAGTTSVVFDKTGTLTQAGVSTPVFIGEDLSSEQQRLILSVVRHSTHPLSAMLTEHLAERDSVIPATFTEEPGRGLQAEVEGHTVRLGSRTWVGAVAGQDDDTASRAYVAIDDKVLGYYRLANRFRDGLEQVLFALKKRFSLSLLTGDRDSERARVENLFGKGADLRFRQSPHDKLAFVNDRTAKGERVLMIGDGLNDAGALKAAPVGISITEKNSAFSPACDGILQADSFELLPRILDMARSSLTVIKASFVLSLLYNVVGLAFAVTGDLSPVIAAILMPASSVTVVLFATLMTTFLARRKGLV